MKLLDRLVGLLYPQVRCLACNEPRRIDEGQALCDSCLLVLATLQLEEGICPHCLSPKKSALPCRYCLEGGMQHISAAFSAYRHHGVAQKLVVALKFGGVHLAAEPLIEGMLSSLDGRSFDALVHIPLHRNRLRERGFDQAALLSSRVATAMGLQLHAALLRCVDTRQQSKLAPHDRRQNVEKAFQVVKPVRGMRLLLVDDVRTTGNTARACARMLLEAGALEVCLLTATVASPFALYSWDAASDSARAAALSATE